MKNLFVRISGLSLIFYLSTSCQVLHNKILASKEFYGINDYKNQAKREQNDIKSSEPIYTKILIIHGIGTQPASYSEAMVEGLVRELELGREPGTDANLSKWYYVNEGLEDGGVLIEQFYKKRNGVLDKNDIYQFFSVHWSAITQPYKMQIKFNDEDPRRKGLPKRIKYTVLTDGLSDVALYTGNARLKERIQAPFYEGLERMFMPNPFADKRNDFEGVELSKEEGNSRGNDSLLISDEFQSLDFDHSHCKPSPINRLYIVSGSFGSKIAFDVIKNLQSSHLTPSIGNRGNVAEFSPYFCHLDVSMFMISNQIPLFYGTGIDEKSNSESNETYSIKVPKRVQADANLSLGGIDYMLEHGGKRIEIIAFNDPNDLLGFKISPDLFCSKKVDITNVGLKNAPINFMGLNFGKAHSGAMRNEKIHKLITEGLDPKMKENKEGKYKKSLIRRFVKGDMRRSRIIFY